MAGKKVFTIEVYSFRIIGAMHDTNMSYKELAKRIGVSERTLRYWLDKGEMEPHMVYIICGELGLCPNKVVRGYKVWMRLGVTVPVTARELDELLEESKTPSSSGRGYFFDDVDLDEDTAAMFLRRAVADGESYVPGCEFDQYEERIKES